MRAVFVGGPLAGQEMQFDDYRPPPIWHAPEPLPLPVGAVVDTEPGLVANYRVIRYLLVAMGSRSAIYATVLGASTDPDLVHCHDGLSHDDAFEVVAEALVRHGRYAQISPAMITRIIDAVFVAVSATVAEEPCAASSSST